MIFCIHMWIFNKNCSTFNYFMNEQLHFLQFPLETQFCCDCRIKLLQQTWKYDQKEILQLGWKSCKIINNVHLFIKHTNGQYLQKVSELTSESSVCSLDSPENHTAASLLNPAACVVTQLQLCQMGGVGLQSWGQRSTADLWQTAALQSE